MDKIAKLENLMTAYDAHVRKGEFLESADPRGWIKSSNILFDACIDAGMSFDEPEHHVWAGERVTAFLLAA